MEDLLGGLLEWVGCREGWGVGGGIRSFELLLNGALKGFALQSGWTICLVPNSVHLWLSSVEIK